MESHIYQINDHTCDHRPKQPVGSQVTLPIAIIVLLSLWATNVATGGLISGVTSGSRFVQPSNNSFFYWNNDIFTVLAEHGIFTKISEVCNFIVESMTFKL